MPPRNNPTVPPVIQAGGTAAETANQPQFAVEVLQPYGDFPLLKRGDIITDPSPEFLAFARTCAHFHVFPKHPAAKKSAVK